MDIIQEEEIIDGLTQTEWAYLNTPIREFDKNHIFTAIAIKDKRAGLIYVENESIRRAEKARKKYDDDRYDSNGRPDGKDGSDDTDKIVVEPDHGTRSGIPVD